MPEVHCDLHFIEHVNEANKGSRHLSYQQKFKLTPTSALPTALYF